MNWIIALLFGAPFLGGVIALSSGYKNERMLRVFLAFAGGYIFSITILHLLPEVFASHDHSIALIVLAGFFFQVFITKISDGAEHGHLHSHKHDHNMALPLGLFLTMCLHAFTEGLPLGFMTGSSSHLTASTMSVGIALHELPAAFALMSILQSEHIKKRTVWILLFVYASMAPLAVFLSQSVLMYLPENLYEGILAFVAGTFLFISTTILFENSENHKFGGPKLTAIMVGVGLALLIHFFE
jgi:zinc and cadmium transporter